MTYFSYAIPDYAMTEEYQRFYERAAELKIRGINTRWSLETIKRKLIENDERRQNGSHDSR